MAARTLPRYSPAALPAVPAPEVLAYDEARDRAGKAAILAALRASAGSRERAREALGMGQRLFYREVERLGIVLPEPAAAVQV